jgi:hypothetical protein
MRSFDGITRSRVYYAAELEEEFASDLPFFSWLFNDVSIEIV